MENANDKDEFSVPVEASTWGAQPEDNVRPFKAGEFVRNYKTQANRASRSSKLADAFVSMSGKLLEQFWGFMKQAVEIAMSKFLVELCAMIIAGISTALAARHSRHMDISTPGVSYNKNGTAAPPSGQSSLWGQRDSGSPFDSGWSRQPAW